MSDDISMNTLPILFNTAADKPIFFYDEEIITHKRFIHDVITVAAKLEQHQYAINLCADRYLFALGFVAGILQQQINLLPASQANLEINALEQDYPDSYRIDDNFIKKALNNKTTQDRIFPEAINAKQTVAILFTSGSSGKPKANPKNWDMLVDSAQRVARQLNLNSPAQHIMVATVPSQHMYGFETTIIFPLVTGVCIHNSKPFFPEDIRHTLDVINKPVILITTPIHLRACTQTNIDWPVIDFVVSATAPLSKNLAQSSETQLDTALQEIYGCSETGVIATRYTTKSSEWQLLSGYLLTEKVTGTCLVTPLTKDEILLPDQIEITDEKHFRLLGRQSDIIKIAGKRGSLNDLKIKLCALEGVDDAIFFMPQENPDEKARLTAFVVADDLSAKEINSFLSQQVDAAFLPRPLIKVKKLPYNETGKLPRKNLLNLYKQLRSHLKNSA